jgi:tetratricopeptide (TPR) repeat protein
VKVTTWILVALALVVLGAIGGLMLSGGRGDPRDLLESALRRFNGPEQDMAATLKELELALRSAETSGDGELAADILIARGRVLSDVEAYGPARADLERALERYRPGAVDIELALVELDEKTGDLSAALTRAKKITDRDPSQLEAWTHSGQILTRMSEERLSELETLCNSNLSDADAQRALGYARKAAGMDADDPLRVSQLAGLRSLFNPPDQGDSLRALALVDEASAASSHAREALVRSFAGPLDRDGVESYLELLSRSGRTQDAVDFGLAVVSHRSVNSSPQFMQRLARVLIDAGRPLTAHEAISLHFNKDSQPGQVFYETWCEALYKAERWKDLYPVANLMRMAGNDHYRSIAFFYMGIATARMHQLAPSEKAFELYMHHDPVEPFPGAIALAWRTQAQIWRSRGQSAKERDALNESVARDPDADGEVWLRLFQILQESEPQDLGRAELYLTRALCLLPQRTNELLPTWLDVGRRRMRASGTELELLLADQRKTGHVGPAPEAGPFELYRFGEMHRDAKEPSAAAACARRLLVAHPGFVPALDILGDALGSMGDMDGAAEVWLDRLRRDRTDPYALRRLARLPAGTLSSAQLIELMQLDPENTGRLEVARTLKAEGRAAVALAGLQTLPVDPLGDEGVLLASELLIATDKYDEALAMLARLNPSRKASSRAFELRLDAARLSGKEDRLLEIIADPARGTDLNPTAMVERVDGMLARGQIEPARALLTLLDSNEATRTREVLLRLATVAMLDRNSAAVSDALDRAEAFDARGSVAFGRVLAALESRIYNRLPIHVRALFQTPFQPTRLQAAILAVLDERLDEARRMIADGRRQNPQDANWAMLEAALEVLAGRTPDLTGLVDASASDETMFTLRGGDRERDPRRLFAHLLAIDSPDWRLWAVADYSRLKPTVPGSLWATYEVGRGLAAARMPQDAEKTWRTVLRTWPTFEPAWDGLEAVRLERLKRFDHVDMVRLRAERRRAIGPRPGEDAEVLLTEAWALELAGNLGAALDNVRSAVTFDPQLAPAWFKLGQLAHRVPNWNESLDALRHAVRFAEVDTDSPIVEEFVSVLRDARAADPSNVSAELVRSELAELAVRFPEDPLVALAQARAELDQEDISPAVRVARAYDRLDRFGLHLEDIAAASARTEKAARSSDAALPAVPTRVETPVTAVRPTLDSLRAGSTGAWKDFYQALEPARAEAFVRAELDRRPGSLELWRMLGETLIAQDRRTEATQLFEMLARMVPDGQTHRALARLYADTGSEFAKVEASIAAAVKLEGRKSPDVDLLYSLGKGLSGSLAGQSRGLQVLAGLWQQRDAAIGRIKDIDIGQLYGTTLVQRADPADRQLATSLLQEVSAAITTDRARKNLVEALSLLAAQIPARTR